MKIQRTIPPTAAPIDLKSIVHGLVGIFEGVKYTKKLENELRDYFGVKHVFLVSSGKAALTIILKALKSLSPGRNRVLIPAYTCFSVPSAIVKAGLKVSLCDIDSSTFDYDNELLEKAIDDNTLCVLPTHLFGIPSDMDRINSLCRKRCVYIIEDAAQAMGGVYKGKKLGTIGDVGFFSLGRGKILTCGSGGIILTNSDRIASGIEREHRSLEKPRFIENLSEFLKVAIQTVFIYPFVYWLPSGLPFLKLGETIFYKDFSVKRLSGMKAGLLRNWQRRLEESNRIRKANGKHFGKLLGLKICKDLSIPFLRIPFLAENKEERDFIYSVSCREGLGISKMYPVPANEIEEIKDQFRGMVFPCAKAAAERLLTVPTHRLLSEKDKERIINQLSTIRRQASETHNHSEVVIAKDG
jgi:perosamine synthetase